MPSQHHGTARPRGLSHVAQSDVPNGRFGRMFRTLPHFEPSDALIDELVALMGEPADPPPDPGAADGGDETSASDNPEIPAGFTYVGQFLDHDLTFDPVSSLQGHNDPNALRDFRTPRLDLDSVYGSGPSDQPFLYDEANPDKMLIGRNPATDEQGNPLEPRDLARNQQHRALIGDKRNDENIIVSQLQLTVIDFHNQVVDDIAAGELDDSMLSGEGTFAAAQRLVRWHYQWAIAFDFLPRIVGHQLVNELLVAKQHAKPGGGHQTIHQYAPEHPFYRVKNAPFMPVEFSAAAYRYGHSMIRPEYDLNDTVTNVPIFVDHPETAAITAHLGGFRALPQQWTIDWSKFFDLDAGQPAQRSRLIDSQLAPPMNDLPANISSDGSIGKSLAFFNLHRGKSLGLPSGQAIAQAMGFDPLTDTDLGHPGPAPLWSYILKEAEVQHAGRHLGQTGGRIVAEVILSLIALDSHSFLRQDPAFTPQITRADPSTFTISDLVTHAVKQR